MCVCIWMCMCAHVCCCYSARQLLVLSDHLPCSSNGLSTVLAFHFPAPSGFPVTCFLGLCHGPLSRVFFVCVMVHCHAFSLYVSWPLCHNTAPTSRSHSNWKVIREISSVQQRGLCPSFLELRVSKMTLDTKDLLIPVIINSSNHSSRFTEIQDKQHNGVSRPPWW